MEKEENKTAEGSNAVLEGLIDKWGREMLRLKAASRNAKTSLEATAYDAISMKIADFLDDLDTLMAD